MSPFTTFPPAPNLPGAAPPGAESPTAAAFVLSTSTGREMTWRERRRIAVRAVCGSAGALFITRCTTAVGSGSRERAFAGLPVGVLCALAGGVAGSRARAGECGHGATLGAPGGALVLEAAAAASAPGPSVRARLENESDFWMKLLMTSQDVELKSEPAVALLLCVSAARDGAGAHACGGGGGRGSVGLGVRAA